MWTRHALLKITLSLLARLLKNPFVRQGRGALARILKTHIPAWHKQGMLRSVVVKAFYQDLQNSSFESSFAIYHRRFSTNTTPKWPLAQPMRMLGHNGEECAELS